jgi:hypothetical protein
MPTPGFTADVSIYRSNRHYVSGFMVDWGPSEAQVTPSDRCWTHCADDPATCTSTCVSICESGTGNTTTSPLCPGGTCCPSKSGTTFECCPVGASCSDGTCVCGGGLTDCAGVCVDLNTNTNNCGGCGLTCIGGTCSDGTCACPNDLSLSNGVCCPQGETGTGGICCQPGLTGSNGVCCAPGLAGTNGICCPPGQTGCGIDCVDMNSDPDNCGGCGRECPSGYTCGEGVCVRICPKNQTEFDACCTGIFAACMGLCSTALFIPACMALCMTSYISCTQCDVWPCNLL